MTALILAKDINQQMRVLIINTFIAEVIFLIALGGFFLGYPIKLYSNGLNKVLLCKINYHVYIMGDLAKFTTLALYAIMVHIFVKYRDNKLKWKIIIPFLVITWSASIIAGPLAYFDAYGVFTDSGFCGVDSTASLYIVSVVLVWLTAVGSTITIIIFTLLTTHYVRHNTLEGNTDLKRAIAKNLLYLLIGLFLMAGSCLLSTLFPVFQRGVPSSVEAVTQKLVGIYFARSVFSISCLLTPIVMMITLKPINDALRQMGKWIGTHCNGNCYHSSSNRLPRTRVIQVHPAVETMTSRTLTTHSNPNLKVHHY